MPKNSYHICSELIIQKVCCNVSWQKIEQDSPVGRLQYSRLH